MRILNCNVNIQYKNTNSNAGDFRKKVDLTPIIQYSSFFKSDV